MRKEIGTRCRLYFKYVENVTAKKPDDYVIATGKNFSVRYL